MLVGELRAMYLTPPFVIASGHAQTAVLANLKDDGPIAFLAQAYTRGAARGLTSLADPKTIPATQSLTPQTEHPDCVLNPTFAPAVAGT